MSQWTQVIPIWVSRPNHDGMISSFTVPIWLFMSVAAVILANVLAWGVIGLIEAFQCFT